jgi:predicted permease
MRILRHLAAWFRRDRLDDELRRELAEHREWKTESLIAEGVPGLEARRRAAVEVGNLTRLHEESRAIWGFPAIDGAVQDARYGWRQLRRTPLFTLATMTTLALTIGGTSTLFAIANAVVLRPLAFSRADRIVSISIAQQGVDTHVMDEPTARLAMAGALPSFESLAAYNTTGANFAGGAEPERVAGVRVSPGYFDVLRLRPAIGRSFERDEWMTGGPPVVILSDALARRGFGSSQDAVNRQVALDDRPYTVIGVMPPGDSFPARRDFWLPLLPRVLGGGGFFYTSFLGRLRDGALLPNARAELLSLRRTHEPELPARARGNEIRIMPLHERLYGEFRAPVLLLLGVVVSVLLIACANVANLLLARAAVRRQELALRAALGASRARVARQLLVESILLAVLGAVPGLVLAVYSLRAFLKFGPVELTRIPGIAIDTRVLMVTLAITVGAGLLFGIAPALAAGRMDSDEALKSAARSGSRHTSRPRRALVIFELAAAVVVVIGAALLAKSLVRFHAIDRGFHADNVLTASMTLPRPRYAAAGARRAFYEGVIGRVRALPGVESAALPAGLDSLSMTMAWPAGSNEGPPGSDTAPIGIVEVGAANFRTFGIPIRSGRECGDEGTADAAAVVVNQRMAQRAFPRGAAVGRQISLGQEGTFTIVGVSADVRGFDGDAMPMAKVYVCADGRDPSTYADIAVRARAGTEPAALAAALRDAVSAVDPAQPVTDIETVRQAFDEAGASRRFDALLFGTFAVLAFVLAIFGLYAVTAYLVAQRTREFGVRIALGAGRGAVMGLVLRQVLPPAACGIGLGVVASVTSTHLLRSLLFEVSTLDVGVFAGVSAALALVSVLAAAIPARRAVRVDPAVALRCE